MAERLLILFSLMSGMLQMEGQSHIIFDYDYDYEHEHEHEETLARSAIRQSSS